MSGPTLSHLESLEAESIHIMREVVAECENPVMLYSIGKDSAVMLHLAMKAFYPAKPPFPLLHVDTTWKFREMIAFRDQMAQKLGLQLLVHINAEGLAQGINPFTHGSPVHTDVMKTQALKQALDKYAFDAAFGGARRDEEKSRARRNAFFRSARLSTAGTPSVSGPSFGGCITPARTKARASAFSRCRTGPSSTSGSTSIWRTFPSCRCTWRRYGRWWSGTARLIMVDDERMPLEPGEKPMMKKVRFRTLGCYPLTGAIESEADTLLDDHSRDAVDHNLRAPGPRHRPR